MRIGLTYTGSDKKHDNYVRWLQSGDGAIEVIRIGAGDGNGDDELTDLDALVLSGGIDIVPEFYSGGNDYAHAPNGWERARDLFEMAALERALERKIPVFGVCRGLQLINVVLGGTLVQDLGEKGDVLHEGAGGIDKQHEVQVVPDSLLGSIIAASGGAPNGLVNSAHHQCIDKLAEGLVVSCRAVDGTIEGIEWADTAQRSFLLAVQWHPERMYTNGFADAAFYGALRDRFIKEIKHNHGNH